MRRLRLATHAAFNSARKSEVAASAFTRRDDHTEILLSIPPLQVAEMNQILWPVNDDANIERDRW